MQNIIFTRHAHAKFSLLTKHGFEITRNQVEETVSNPDRVFPQRGDRFIAQKVITDRHVLRVVFREEGDTRVIITFYPGRRDRYES